MNDYRKEPIGRYISQIYRKGYCFINKGLVKYGICGGQLMFLFELYNKDGISQEELSEKLHIDKGTTAKAINKLEEANLVIRKKDEKDRRAYRIFLTERGGEIKGDICDLLSSWNDIIFSTVEEEEGEFLLNILKKVCDSGIMK